MKKTLITIFSILAVIIIIMLVWNLVFGQDLIGTIWNAFADMINDMWSGITGEDLIETDQSVSSVSAIEAW